MIKNNSLTLLCALILLFTENALSMDDCILDDKATTNEAKKYIQCLDRNIANLKRTQKTWINKLNLDLEKIQEDTGNTQLLPIFTRSLTSHTRFLEDSCRWRYLQKMPNATQAAIVYKRCEILLLDQYIATLKQPL
ncbi:hypothetical protein AMS58_17095 [Pseudoalteromonas porphyrae]|uniref:Lysozyme inhibitor LprI N-terminal domain-containing protein n=3 Tax=Pseudoalteromonas TaxID=53246 RepID=A0A0N0LWQ1_9GAMM|nr:MULTISPECIES: hypothetical protein [Pseudoalteromonas]KPH59668.1 hypothetical protein ADS77_16930 [Pseudoalteromonas porphyrae]KPH93456.1 hypothetical protein AMS58_17095 [Pseudoalteromonas porphyrae]NMR26995.1 hypothetical protein [Pseudoalteromonas sp. NEC-BIFX-2020_015]